MKGRKAEKSTKYVKDGNEKFTLHNINIFSHLLLSLHLLPIFLSLCTSSSRINFFSLERYDILSPPYSRRTATFISSLPLRPPSPFAFLPKRRSRRRNRSYQRLCRRQPSVYSRYYYFVREIATCIRQKGVWRLIFFEIFAN